LKSYKQIDAVKTSFGILDVLKLQDRPVSGADVARETALPHATVMSHLTTLEAIGAVERIGDLYLVGFKLATFWIEAKRNLEAQRIEVERKLQLINY